MGSLCINWANGESRGSQAAETLGGVDASIPYLITPRHALLLSPTPLLRWNPVSGVTEYSIEVIGPKGVMWKTKNEFSCSASKLFFGQVPDMIIENMHKIR